MQYSLNLLWFWWQSFTGVFSDSVKNLGLLGLAISALGAAFVFLPEWINKATRPTAWQTARVWFDTNVRPVALAIVFLCILVPIVSGPFEFAKALDWRHKAGLRALAAEKMGLERNWKDSAKQGAISGKSPSMVG